MYAHQRLWSVPLKAPESIQRRAFVATLVPPSAAAWAQGAQQRPFIRRAWLGEADRRHGHDALGMGSYPGSLHALVEYGGQLTAVRLDLPADSAFEDGLVRRVDLSGRGSDDIVLVAASRVAGAAIVVYGVELHGSRPVLRERARSEAVGRGRWLNPVGFGDFDGDGRLEVVSVSTPHIGGVLTLYRYQPPHLVVLAQTGNVSNHVYGEQEQRLAVVLKRHNSVAVAIPDQSRYRLRTLSVGKRGAWEAVEADVMFERPIDRVIPTGAGRQEVLAGAERRLLP